YAYQGCYTEATTGRALSQKSYYNDSMTVELCAAACVGYKWFGVEYGRECYCGSSPNAGSVPAPESDCSFSCPGNATETCGAGVRLSMYLQGGTSVTTPSAPSGPKPPAGYDYVGCYTEAKTGRALPDLAYTDNSMTLEECAATCSGFTYFGVEYYHECHCGNAIASTAAPAAETDCKLACSGNKSEICGGNSRLSIFKVDATVPPPPPPALAPYTSQGCYTEATTGRALTGKSYFDDAMTVEKCASACSAYLWFGVEYGRECYCGNDIKSGSVPTNSQECSFACPGNSTETCGAGSRLNMYTFG
ncbi:WSC-domain protein, partial [Xylogone sp. PMI_703]